MKLCTIGFTGKTAEDFFSRLRGGKVKRVLDVRLNNVSQLAGFSKRDDLKFFTKEIAGAEYLHLPLLAPTKGMLDEYRKRKRGWDNYEKSFRELMAEREIDKKLDPQLIDGGCLLCSEDKPHHCHRRIVAEYLKEKWSDVEIIHL
jgi:uncharacterized protein (DUF488 family)